MKYPAVLACSITLLLSACSGDRFEEEPFQSDRPDYYVVDESLTRIRSDFNAMQDKIRLVFIVGPSCGICLRGMDDLNESIVRSVQSDPRIHTLVIHVPTLGAQEKHVAGSIPLLSGPRVTHYWDPSGNTGIEFKKTLDIPMYAWDLWFVYQPGIRWADGDTPPYPDYWEHQLPGLAADKMLDARRFAGEVNGRLAELPPATEQAKFARLRERDAGILPVAQPRGVIIRQNHLSRGGYDAIKQIRSIRIKGTTEIGGEGYPLRIDTGRPFHYKRIVGDPDNQSLVSWDGSAVRREGPGQGLPAAFLDEVLTSFEFDGWMTDWKDKGHQVSRLGMKKVGERLPWLMEAGLTNGRTWHIYVDSHTGDAFRTTLIDAGGNERIRIEYSDYRDADGFRLPHRIQYFEQGRLLATDRFSSIQTVSAADTSKADMT
ncbi:MAG: hypothetical protein ACE5FV_13350 [Woeseia sp.]